MHSLHSILAPEHSGKERNVNTKELTVLIDVTAANAVSLVRKKKFFTAKLWAMLEIFIKLG